MKVGDKWLSLNALRSFEVAGRHLNMSRAADELGITQSAVSHQVRQLERMLDIDLFIRTGRNVRLSPAGVKLLATVQKSFDAISTTLLSVDDDVVEGELRIASDPGFTFLWLSVQLPKFLKKYPGLTFRRSALPSEANELKMSVDVAVSYGGNQFSGRRVVMLAQLNFSPVCSSSLIPKGKQLVPDDLKEQTLIHNDDGRAWSNWFATFGVDQMPSGRNLYVGSLPVAMVLAKGGCGFALNDGLFGSALSKDYGLVRPFDETIENYERYYLVTHPEDEMSPAAKEFEKWIRNEVTISRDQHELKG
jgi:DNA-binding transcriptional LysR family regulator